MMSMVLAETLDQNLSSVRWHNQDIAASVSLQSAIDTSLRAIFKDWECNYRVVDCDSLRCVGQRATRMHPYDGGA